VRRNGAAKGPEPELDRRTVTRVGGLDLLDERVDVGHRRRAYSAQRQMSRTTQVAAARATTTAFATSASFSDLGAGRSWGASLGRPSPSSACVSVSTMY